MVQGSTFVRNAALATFEDYCARTVGLSTKSLCRSERVSRLKYGKKSWKAHCHIRWSFPQRMYKTAAQLEHRFDTIFFVRE